MKLNPVKKTNSYVSATDFIKSVKDLYELSNGQANGFIAFMSERGMYNLLSEQAFIPYLKLYLGKQ